MVVNLGPDQLLWCDRVPTTIRVERIEPPVHSRQRLIHQQPNRSQRMIVRDKVIELRHREQAFLHRICTTHRHYPEVANVTTTQTTSDAKSALEIIRISTAC